jgi:hypothetical protein
VDGPDWSALWGGEPWWLGPASFLVGGAVGALLTWTVLRPDHARRRALESEVERLTAELAGYRDQVHQHFQRTAELFQGMTAAYRAVYAHLADGAATLCGAERFAPALDAESQRFVAGPAESAAREDAGAGASPSPEAFTVSQAQVGGGEGNAAQAPRAELARDPAARGEPGARTREDRVK